MKHKTVGLGPNCGRIYLPREWVGKGVTIILKELPGKDVLQLKFRPDEVEPFIEFVLNSPPSRFKRDLVDMLRKECML